MGYHIRALTLASTSLGRLRIITMANRIILEEFRYKCHLKLFADIQEIKEVYLFSVHYDKGIFQPITLHHSIFNANYDCSNVR